MIASDVTTPQPPAVVSTTTFGPAWRGLGGERRRGLERLLDGRGARDAGGPALAVEHLVVGGERPGVARRGASAALGGAALDQHERLARRRAGELVQQRPAVDDALRCTRGRRPSRDRRRRSRGSRPTVTADALPAETARRDADTGRPGVVEEARHEVAALAGDADPAGRRVRGDDLGAQRGGRADDALTVRTGEQDAELVGERRPAPARRAGPRRRPRRSPPT